MSKRKQAARQERRREHVEINLLEENEEVGRPAKRRRGCSLPFLGGLLVVSLVALLHAVLA